MATRAFGRMAAPPTVSIEFRPSTRAFLLHSGSGWLLIAATVLTMGMAAVITVPALLITWVVNRSSSFSLEGDRLLMRRGLLMRSEEEIELYRVKDVKASFSVIQQMFGNGDLAIISSDATGSGSGRRKEFKISNVEEVRDIRETLRTRVDAARRSMGVREYDVA